MTIDMGIIIGIGSILTSVIVIGLKSASDNTKHHGILHEKINKIENLHGERLATLEAKINGKKKGD